MSPCKRTMNWFRRWLREKGRERERQREWEMKGTEVARGLRAPRDRAFNYCTARTNLRASGHRCRTPENQFRGRHIQSTRAEGRTKWGVLFRKLGSKSTWQRVFSSFSSEVNTNINHAIYAIYESHNHSKNNNFYTRHLQSVHNYSCVICKFLVFFTRNDERYYNIINKHFDIFKYVLSLLIKTENNCL